MFNIIAAILCSKNIKGTDAISMISCKLGASIPIIPII